MALLVEPKKYTLATEGIVDAVVGAVQDIGMCPVPAEYGGGVVHKLRLVWIVDGQFDEQKKPVIVMQRLNLSMHKKANLRKTATAILGRDPGAGVFDAESLLGISKQLLIEHDAAKQFANVRAILKAQKTVAVPAGWTPPPVKQAEGATAGPGPQAAQLPSEVTDDDISF